jgi:uncharacterized repeat protein (TIGR01451 family)
MNTFLSKYFQVAGLLLLLQPLFGQNTVHIRGKVFGPQESVIKITDINDPTFNQTQVTNPVGIYDFEVPIGGNYTVTPINNENPLNGVSTYDKVLISRHIDNIQPFTYPYQYIAADVNNDNLITAADTSEIYKVILGIYTEFPNNSSWRFVRMDYVFPDPLQPFPYPETATFPNLTQDVANVNFIAIKVGDLNYNAIGSSFPGYFQSAITGMVRSDANGDCIADASETDLNGWILKAVIDGNEYFSTTSGDGTYFLPVPPGTGTVELIAPNNPLWNECNNGPSPVTTSVGLIQNKSYAMTALASAPSLEVDITTPFLRRCFDNNYSVQYCNYGTISAQNVKIKVKLDEYLDFLGASVPYTLQIINSDSIYIFDVGSLAMGECGYFTIFTHLSCTATLGQTHCSTATIGSSDPIDPLLQNPTSNLEITGDCNGNEVVFTIKNTGADMTEPVEYVVIEDIIIQMVSNPIQLNAGEIETITLPANGSTWRIEMAQNPNHPWSLLASANIEGCGTNGNGTFSLGFIPQFPQDDAAPFVDEDCLVNIGAYDPNDKQGFPLGTGNEHVIRPGQSLDYLIRFQNTGTDTAFNIIILDTLSSKLDITSVQLLGSSHPCEMKLHESNILQFVFKNIMLPDSNVNEATSHGFVKFHIKPKTGLPNGTKIENQAGIYFDFNAPVMTNLTLHTINELVLETNNIVTSKGVSLDVFPNPTQDVVFFQLKKTTITQGQVTLYDLQGKKILSEEFNHNLFKINTLNLNSGAYFFRIESEGVGFASGKLLVEK